MSSQNNKVIIGVLVGVVVLIVIVVVVIVVMSKASDTDTEDSEAAVAPASSTSSTPAPAPAPTPAPAPAPSYPPPTLSATTNFTIQQKSSKKCLQRGTSADLPSNQDGGGTAVVFQSDCSASNAANLFRFLPNGQIVQGDRCLLAAGGAVLPGSDNAAVLWGPGCNDTRAVKFKVEADGKIKHSGGRCLSHRGGGANAPDRAPLVFRDCSSATSFNVIPA